jgi:Bacterial protein of unknown function (DUF922)
MSKDQGAKPSFKVEWTKKDSATYTVQGSYDDVYKFYEKRNASKEEWGKFSVTKPNIAFKPNKGPITEVVLKIGYTITMPKWSGYNDAKKSCKEAWDKMFSSLEKHEDGHRLILLEEVAIFGEKVTSQTDLDQKKLAELLKDFSPSIDKAQKKFDDATDHGAKKGVFLPAPDQCK